MTHYEFKQWVESRLSSFAHALPEKDMPWVAAEMNMIASKKNFYTCYLGNFFITGNLLTRETTIFNTQTKRHATAKCKIGEIFDINTGVAIAWAKYNHESVPDYAEDVNREGLMNGDKFFSSMNKNVIYTFVGWMPNTKDGFHGKWAIVLDRTNKPCKVQIANTVIKTE